MMNQWFIAVCNRSSEKGVTLLELLVSVVMVGILSAIAAPSLLSFSLRARHAEAQVNVGAILRAQQYYYVTRNEFATTLPSLALGISDSEFYQYKTDSFNDHQTLAGIVVTGTTAIAIPLKDVRGYMGKVWLDGSTGTLEMQSVICEGDIGDTYFMNDRTYCP